MCSIHKTSICPNILALGLEAMEGSCLNRFQLVEFRIIDHSTEYLYFSYERKTLGDESVDNSFFLNHSLRSTGIACLTNHVAL